MGFVWDVLGLRERRLCRTRGRLGLLSLYLLEYKIDLGLIFFGLDPTQSGLGLGFVRLGWSEASVGLMVWALRGREALGCWCFASGM